MPKRLNDFAPCEWIQALRSQAPEPYSPVTVSKFSDAVLEALHVKGGTRIDYRDDERDAKGEQNEP